MANILDFGFAKILHMLAIPLISVEISKKFFSQIA